MTGREGCPERGSAEPHAQDLASWAWEFLRRNRAYCADWRSSVPRRLPAITLRDGTHLLRLRRRYPAAERWGLYAFSEPAKAASQTPVFWLPGIHGRLVRARAVAAAPSENNGRAPLAPFNAVRNAAIGVDGIAVATLQGQGQHVAVELRDLAVLTRPVSLVFELDRLDDLNRHTECLKTLQRFCRPPAAQGGSSPFANDERLRHALIALDQSMAGKTYRQIAIALFGEARVADEWGGTSQFLKDRTRRLVAKGHELMEGGYRDLLR
jgi:hypothetical protein